MIAVDVRRSVDSGRSEPAGTRRRPLDTKPDFELTFYINATRWRPFLVEVAVPGLPPAKGGHQSPIHIEARHLDRARLLLEAVAQVIPSDFAPLRCAVALDLTLYSPMRCPPGDALNFLGGVGDVLQRKPPDLAGHLGMLADLALYNDDRQIRRVRFDQRTAADLSYVVRVRALGRDPLLPDYLPARRRNPKVNPGRPVPGTVQLAVAFANSTDAELSGYNTLIEWCVLQRTLTEEVAASLRTLAASCPIESAALMTQVRDLRHAIRTLLSSSVLNPDSLLAITTARRRCAAHEVVELVGSLVTTRCDARANDLGLPLCAIWASAAGVLDSDSQARVRRCADESCGKLFIDESRNRSRRWCDMSSCGNRAKIRRFRQRKRASKTKATR
jgi:predicted RNA-binding Zn ribbon-like protein